MAKTRKTTRVSKAVRSKKGPKAVPGKKFPKAGNSAAKSFGRVGL